MQKRWSQLFEEKCKYLLHRNQNFKRKRKLLKWLMHGPKQKHLKFNSWNSNKWKRNKSNWWKNKWQNRHPNREVQKSSMSQLKENFYLRCKKIFKVPDKSQKLVEFKSTKVWILMLIEERFLQEINFFQDQVKRWLKMIMLLLKDLNLPNLTQKPIFRWLKT